jgi:hypothetical protein
MRVIAMGRTISCLLILRVAIALLLGCVMAQAIAEVDPPGRVARINYTEGQVAYAPAGDNEWTDADLNRPLLPGDKLWTDPGVRAEIQAGSSIVRMDGKTRLAVLAIDDRSVQFSVTQGIVFLRVRALPEGDNVEVDTPNLAYRAAYPGEYRIDVDAQQGVTRVTIHSGTGAAYGGNGQALPMGGGQQITFTGRALEKVNVQKQSPQDNFDRWVAERKRRDDQSVAARYVPREAVGLQLLDASGEWRQDAKYGPVWYPQGVPANWAPYRNGRWEWIAPWGWTWIDEAPWAFVTSHYGRWALTGNRWAWAPGHPGLKPIYAPALVAFVGEGGSPLAIAGKQAVAWFPLAPGEAWQPAYRATPQYISGVNANIPALKQGPYAHERKPEAITALAVEDFQRGRPVGSNWLRVAANTIANAQVTPPPPMPQPQRTMVARPSEPTPAPQVRQVTSNATAVQQQKIAERRKDGRDAVATRRAEQAKRESHAKDERKLQARRAQEAKRLAAAAKRDEQARQLARAQQLAQARRTADRDAQVLAQQRAQREAWRMQQEAIAAQFRRDQQAYEEEQRARAQRPAPEPELRQQGIPILNWRRAS